MANCVLVVAGTRPEIIKLSPVFKWLQKLKIPVVFVWSGQHYDYELCEVFFKELGLPEPDVNLNVKSGSHSFQTAKLMIGLERVISRFKPSIAVAEGDTNTVMATALASIKSQVPFAHVEAGLRSYDRRMPEEVNRVVADSCSELLFAPTELAVTNLTHEGIPLRKICLTGNTIVDVVNEYRETASEKGKKLLKEFDVDPEGYLLLTLHRQENTDDLSNLSKIVQAISVLSEKHTVIFPVHPRTKNRLLEVGIFEALEKKQNLILAPCLGYFEFLGLLSNSLAVLTDSGGVQEEAFLLGTPAVTLRYNTERPETVLYGGNVLAGTDPHSIIELATSQMARSCDMKKQSEKWSSPFGKGDAGEKIAKSIKNAVKNGIKVESSDTRSDPYIVYMLVDSAKIRNKRNPKKDEFEVFAAYDSNGYPTFVKRSHVSGQGSDKTLIRLPLSKARRA